MLRRVLAKEMNTPAHLIFAAAAFSKPDAPRRNAAILAGALAPDLSLYVLSMVSLFVLELEPDYVFGTLYFSELWQSIFRIDNSFFVWGALLVLALWRGWENARFFALAGLLHLIFDLPLHHDDGRAHFWPLTNWIFESPLSYWDPAQYGVYVGGLEIIVSLALCALLWRRFTSPAPRALIALGAALELLPGIMWAMMFA